jgi:hypothetical protein
MKPEVEFVYEKRCYDETTPPNSPEVQFMGVRICKPVITSPEVQFLGERSSNPSGQISQVQLLGERNINKNGNDMSVLSDNLYNAGLSLGNSSLSRGKENKPPKRVVNRSSFLCSPFEINSTISSKYGPHEMKLYETITTLCDDPEYQEYVQPFLQAYMLFFFVFSLRVTTIILFYMFLLIVICFVFM